MCAVQPEPIDLDQTRLVFRLHRNNNVTSVCVRDTAMFEMFKLASVSLLLSTLLTALFLSPLLFAIR
jgi:hypothetical protein